MTRITEEQLAKLDRLHSEATPGAWRHATDGDGFTLIDLGPGRLGTIGELLPANGNREADADLIAAMRNALPDLLATVREQAAEIELLTEAWDVLHDTARDTIDQLTAERDELSRTVERVRGVAERWDQQEQSGRITGDYSPDMATASALYYHSGEIRAALDVGE